MKQHRPIWVVADIGGTNCRIAQLSDDRLHHTASYRCRDYSKLSTLLAHYLQAHNLHKVALCVAVAAPVSGDRVTMTNLQWSFSRTSLSRELDLAELLVINDYTAQAMAIPFLDINARIQVGGTTPQPGQPITVCGPGTGLGVAHLIPVDDNWRVIPTEGGHVDFVPFDETELFIYSIVHRKFSHVSAERLLSGPGLELLCRSLCELNQLPEPPWSACEISTRALSGKCEICIQTLQYFCAMLGSFCGDLALTMGAFGGVYISGGIVPKFPDFLLASDFRKRFEAKGRYQQYNAGIPCFIVTAPEPGLLGAAAYIRQNTDY
ncbi:MAG: glucokinase [Pseudohongiellaceae bacterium]